MNKDSDIFMDGPDPFCEETICYKLKVISFLAAPLI